MFLVLCKFYTKVMLNIYAFERMYSLILPVSRIYSSFDIEYTLCIHIKELDAPAHNFEHNRCFEVSSIMPA